MIFPDKPRPPWRTVRSNKLSKEIKTIQHTVTNKVKDLKPKGYYRERIELALIFIFFYFWIQFWSQFK